MPVLAIVRRDLRRYRRNPVRTALLFALPLVMAGVFAVVFGGGGTDEIRIRVLLWDADDSLLSRLAEGAAGSEEAADRLDIVPVGPEGLEMMERGEASALVHIPEGFSRAVLDGVPTTLEVVKNPAERFLPQVVEEGVGLGAAVLSAGSTVFRPELETIAAMMDREGFPPSAAVGALSAGITDRLRGAEGVLFPPLLTLETVDAVPDGAAEPGPTHILAFFLPGLAVMGVLFVAQSATRDILRDREAGLLKHLLTAPISPGGYLAGKCLSVLAITAGGLLLLLAIGAATGIDWGSPVALVVLIPSIAVGCSGTLLLIISLVGSERQGDTLTTIVIIVWSMLGGAFVPLDQMPAFLRPLSASTLVFWATDALNTLVLRGGGLADIAANIAVLLGAGLGFMAVGAAVLGRRIRRGAV